MDQPRPYGKECMHPIYLHLCFFILHKIQSDVKNVNFGKLLKNKPTKRNSRYFGIEQVF